MRFEEFKAKVSIMTVAHDLGYRFDRSEGKNQPHFVRKDKAGNIIDDINIKNPNINETQGYWRRHPAPGQLAKGDLISFVKENKREFDEFVLARNDIDLVNRVLSRYAGVNMSIGDVFRGTMGIDGHERKAFDLSAWDRVLGLNDAGRAIMRARGFSAETMDLFKGCVEMIRNRNSTNRFYNLAFPYTVPGSEKVMGYEIRGFGTFKSKAEGTESERSGSCWCAYLGNKTEGWQKRVKDVHLAESAYDVMAFAELNRALLDLDRTVFVSMGGQFADMSLRKIKEAFPNAIMNLHFDNDMAGVAMTCKAIALLNGKELKVQPKEGRTVYSMGEQMFSIAEGENTVDEFCRKGKMDMSGITVRTAPGMCKDWNDALKAQVEEKSGRAEANARMAMQRREAVKEGKSKGLKR